MTARETLRRAASELVNCEATSDANADEQLELAAALRALADRMDAEMAKWGEVAKVDRGCASERRLIAELHLSLLARLDAPLTPAPVPTVYEFKSAADVWPQGEFCSNCGKVRADHDWRGFCRGPITPGEPKS